MKNKIKTIAFDADDTLWVNEVYFQDAEVEFCRLLVAYASPKRISEELLKTEQRNLTKYGFGIKGFVLCMIETAHLLAEGKLDPNIIGQIIALGHALLEKPVELLPAVQDTLSKLTGNYQLVLATKGDLLDQQRKIKKSNLADLFTHQEIMSDKLSSDYVHLMKQLNCSVDQFLMVGNSVKSDILPVLELGAYAGHIPYHVTWAHEEVRDALNHDRLIHLKQLDDLLLYL